VVLAVAEQVELADITVKILAMMAVPDCYLTFRVQQLFMPAVVVGFEEMLLATDLHKVQAVQ
jgi:hypothetical protein